MRDDCVLDDLRVRWPCTQSDIRGGFNRDRAVSAGSDGLGVVLAGRDNILRNSVIAYSMGDGVSMFGVSNAWKIAWCTTAISRPATALH